MKRVSHLFLCFLLASPLVFTGAAAGAEGQGGRAQGAELLEALRDLRAAAFRRAASGRGTATMERREAMAPGKENLPSYNIDGDRVQFSFTGSACLVRQLEGRGSQELLWSWMVKDEVETLYTPADATRRAQVLIRKSEHPVFSVDLREWTFARIARIPNTYSPDGEVFEAWLRRPEVKATKDGNIVHVSVISNIPRDQVAGRLLEERQYDFDLLHDGMIVRHVYRHRSRRASERTGDLHLIETLENGTVAWKKVDGNTVPLTWECEVTHTRDGALQQQRSAKLTFTEFAIEAIDPSLLEMTELGIPKGTPVQDTIRGRTWRYGVETDTVSPTTSASGDKKGSSKIPSASN